MFKTNHPELSSNLRRWIALSFATIALAIIDGHGRIGNGTDAHWYRLLAEGRTDLVRPPFTNRQFHPLLIKEMHRLTSFSLETSFAVIGVLCLATMVALVFRILLKSGVPVWVGAFVGLSYFWALNFGNYILPDLFDAFLLTIFLYFLWSGRYLLAMCMLFPLELTRESTSLVLVCLLIAGFRKIRWYLLATAMIAFAGGKQVVAHLTKVTLASRHGLGEGLYDLLKIPWNLARNVFGVCLWTTTLQDFCQQPRWVISLPGHIHFGGIHDIGYCFYDPGLQLLWLLLSFSMFGLLPLILVFLANRNLKSLWPDDVFLRFCIVYGSLSFLLAPLLGASVDRLIAYSWPAFLLGVPLLLVRNRVMEHLQWRLLLVLHIVLCWIGILAQRLTTSARLYALVVAGDIVLFWWAWRLIRRASQPESGIKRRQVLGA
jgi:hypothetical protein